MKNLKYIAGAFVVATSSALAQATNPFSTTFQTEFGTTVDNIIEGISWAGGAALGVFAILMAFRGFKKIAGLIMR